MGLGISWSGWSLPRRETYAKIKIPVCVQICDQEASLHTASIPLHDIGEGSPSDSKGPRPWGLEEEWLITSPCSGAGQTAAFMARQEQPCSHSALQAVVSVGAQGSTGQFHKCKPS